MRILRWTVFLPVALLVSAVILQCGYVAVLLCGGGSVLLWIPVGAIAALAYFHVAFSLAPGINAIVKWSCVLVAGAISMAVLIGSVLSSVQLALAAAYAPMAAAAIYYATRPLNSHALRSR
ncbi:MAG: hypothetical protein ABSH23_11275 [Steroidobacteraceae bacterium]|jgi:hypothetical protein